MTLSSERVIALLVSLNTKEMMERCFIDTLLLCLSIDEAKIRVTATEQILGQLVVAEEVQVIEVSSTVAMCLIESGSVELTLQRVEELRCETVSDCVLYAQPKPCVHH